MLTYLDLASEILLSGVIAFVIVGLCLIWWADRKDRGK